MIKEPSEALLDDFTTPTDPSERIRTLSELVTIKAIPKWADDSDLGTGPDRWVELTSRSDAAPRDRLLAIAELIHATQPLRKTNSHIGLNQ